MKNPVFVFLIVLIFPAIQGFAQRDQVDTSLAIIGDTKIFSLNNRMVDQRVVIQNDQLKEDDLIGQKNWLSNYGGGQDGVYTDANFALKMMWTDWMAPGKIFNGDLRVEFTKKDFRLVGHQFRDGQNGAKDLDLFFTPINHDNSIQLKITYALMPGKFYARRRISIMDSTKQTNWLEEWISREGRVGPAKWTDQNNPTLIRQESSQSYQAIHPNSQHQEETSFIVKRGAFGQPCALDFKHGGVFFGISSGYQFDKPGDPPHFSLAMQGMDGIGCWKGMDIQPMGGGGDIS